MTDTALTSLFHRLEDYFFTSISHTRHDFAHAASAYLTGVDAESLNLLIVRAPDAQFDAMLRGGMQHFETAGLPYSVVVPGDAVDRVGRLLSEEGLMAAYTSMAMQLDVERFVALGGSSEVHDIRCTNGCLDDWALPLESAFETSPEVMLQYRERHRCARDSGRQLSHFSLYVKGHPVGSLTLSMIDRMARLDDLGIHVDFQGKGYARALMQHALAHARSAGVSRCFLEASQDGASLYRKAGFSTLFDYAAFHRG